MLKKLTLLLLITYVNISISTAQEQNLPTNNLPAPKCGSISTRADRQRTRDFLAQNPKPQFNEALTIPVVFHVFTKTEYKVTKGDGIQFLANDWSIGKVLEKTNRNFRNENPWVSEMPAAIKGLAIATGIQLCLATKGPDGRASKGIVYHNDVTLKKIEAKGDISQVNSYLWNTDLYLNIVIVDYPDYLNETIAHITSFDKPPFYIVLNSNSIMLNGSPFPIYKDIFQHTSLLEYVANTLTHETGHILDLHHIHGDADDCDADDGIEDTPLQAALTEADYIKDVKFPIYDKCTSKKENPNGILFHNYMDYYPLSCMFTPQQVAVMQNALKTKKIGWMTSEGCKEGNCWTDKYEPNNDSESAKLINIIDSPTPTITITGTICKGDEDYFTFNSDDFYKHAKITLWSMPGDYDLEVSYETEKGEFILDESVTNNEKEIIVANDLKAGEHLIRVFSKKGEYNPYYGYYLTVQTNTVSYLKQSPSLNLANAPATALYPNPAKDKITINLDGEKLSQVSIQDIYGKNYYEKSLKNSNTQELDVSQWPEGLYILKINDGRTGRTEKFVIKK